MNETFKIQICFCLLFPSVLLTLALSGCGKGDTAAKLKLEHINSINLPPDGRKIPAPRSVTVAPDGKLVILDDCGNVTVSDAEGKILKKWKMPDSRIGRPEGVCVIKDGRIAVSDTHYNRVVIFNPDGSISNIYGSKGSAEGQFGNPVGITQDSAENIYVSEYGEVSRVQKFTRDWKFIKSFGETGTGPGQFQRASGLAWHEGKIYVTDAVNDRINVFSENGDFLSCLGGEGSSCSFYLPYDLCFQGSDMLVVEYGGSRISRVGAGGELKGRFGAPGRNMGEFTTPWGIATDSLGRIFVADTGNRRIAVLK